jgi:hypothetical protein
MLAHYVGRVTHHKGNLYWQVGKGSRIFAGRSTFANSMVALRKKFQLNGTNLFLEGRLLTRHAPSHLLRESNHKR